MGSGGTKIEKPNVATQEEESGELHIFELHLPTAGAGIQMIMIVLLLLWCALPVLKRWRNTKRSKPRRGASPTLPHHSTRWDPPCTSHIPGHPPLMRHTPPCCNPNVESLADASSTKRTRRSNSLHFNDRRESKRELAEFEETITRDLF